MASLEQIAGTVSRVTEKSFQIEERPGTWLRPSQFADPMPALPELGDRVTLGLDTKGFVRTIEYPLHLISSPVPEPMPPQVQDARAAAGRSVDGKADRETVIGRLAILKAASHIAASRPEMKREDLFSLAEAMEAWTGR